MRGYGCPIQTCISISRRMLRLRQVVPILLHSLYLIDRMRKVTLCISKVYAIGYDDCFYYEVIIILVLADLTYGGPPACHLFSCSWPRLILYSEWTVQSSQDSRRTDTTNYRLSRYLQSINFYCTCAILLARLSPSNHRQQPQSCLITDNCTARPPASMACLACLAIKMTRLHWSSSQGVIH